jgi:N-acyl-D-amino-acid deacylase
VDAILRGGEVVDGTGAPRRRADVEVAGGRIARVVESGAASVLPEVDVAGRVVAPGFIDLHSHSDLAVLADSRHVAKLEQGVTLEVVGQDGLGYAPVDDAAMAQMRARLAGWNGDPDLDFGWRGVGDYLDRVDRGAALNVAVLVPHGTVRWQVLGDDPRPAGPAELDRMRAIVDAGLAEGAFGLSAGLSYVPGSFASDDELVEVLRPVHERGAFYAPHHRNYGTLAIESYRACLDIARRAGVALHLAHAHLNFPVNRGRAPELLALIDAALDEGLDVTLDAYPYLASATSLVSLLPHEAGEQGPDGIRRRLADPVEGERLRIAVEETGSDGNHGVPADWEAISISSAVATSSRAAVGRSVADVARERGVRPWDVVTRLLLDDDLATGCVLAVGNEENMRAIMRHRAHTVGTDGILVGASPHPRGWGSFPRFLGTYARDLGLLSLEEAVHHATGRAARRLGLADRGVVAPGAAADLVVFDPERIGSDADLAHPTRRPSGIEQVWVNGELAVDRGARTDVRAGRAIRAARRSAA